MKGAFRFVIVFLALVFLSGCVNGEKKDLYFEQGFSEFGLEKDRTEFSAVSAWPANKNGTLLSSFNGSGKYSGSSEFSFYIAEYGTCSSGGGCHSFSKRCFKTKDRALGEGVLSSMCAGKPEPCGIEEFFIKGDTGGLFGFSYLNETGDTPNGWVVGKTKAFATGPDCIPVG